MRKLINRLSHFRSYLHTKKLPLSYCKRTGKFQPPSKCKNCEDFQPNFQIKNSIFFGHLYLNKSSKNTCLSLVEKNQNPQKVIPYLKVASHKIITDFAITTGARLSEIFNLSVGDFRSIKVVNQDESDYLPCNAEQPTYYFRIIGKAHLPRLLILKQKTMDDVLNYCNNERKDNDKNHRCFNELEDSEKIFINHYGSISSPISFELDWKQACLKSGINIKSHQIRFWDAQSINPRT